MISPKELLEKSEKQFYGVVSRMLKGEEVFPMVIPSNKKLAGTKYSDIRDAVLPLYQHSKKIKGKGYTVEWKEKLVDGTKQKIPGKIFFETPEDYLFYCKKESDYQDIKKAFTMLTDAFPALTEWATRNVKLLHNEAPKMAAIIKVCTFFSKTAPPHDLYLRELPVEVHSKFIEENAPLLKSILDIILPPEWVNKKEADFSSRYYIRKPGIYTQIRVLDESLRKTIGFNELALTIDDFGKLDWKPEKVFIIENRACFLSFPKVKNGVAIFGEGFKSRINKFVPWIEGAELYCWFDLDPAGFEMLNIIRQYYTKAKSFLMDEETYTQFSEFSVSSAYRRLPLEHLNIEELKLYEFLQANSRRLEQERITNIYISKQLKLHLIGD